MDAMHKYANMKKCLKFNNTFNSEVNFMKHMDNEHRWRKNRYTKIIGLNKLENSFVNDLKLIVKSQEHDSDLDSDPTNCMECSEVFMNRSDLSDHMRKVLFEDEIMLVICDPKRGVLLLPEVR